MQVTYDTCNIWVHTKCNKLSNLWISPENKLQLVLSQMFIWNYCLFNNFKWRIFRIETRQKNIKFKALAIRQPDQTTELIDKINNAIDNPENKNSNWEALSSGRTSICHVWFSLQSFVFSFKHLIPSLSLWISIHLPKIKQKWTKIL